MSAYLTGLDLYSRGLEIITTMEGGGTTWRDPIAHVRFMLRTWCEDRLVDGSVLGATFDTACQTYLQGFAN